MERNLRLYPWYLAARWAAFWVPVFFLYFASVLGPSEVLLLEALYYLGVVVAEVPSGYLSDRVGRRPTLLISAAASTLGCATFVLTGAFLPFVAAQLGLAVGMAFNSGTDTALLYDSLRALGREDEIAEHEARGQSAGLAAMAAAALLGGLIAGLDLRLAYALTAVTGALAWAAAWHFVEPPGSRALPAARQLVEVTKHLRDPTLRWVFALCVAMTVFSHVPYELFQPWLELLLAGFDRPGYAVTPAVAGVMIGAALGLSSWATRHAPALQRRFGVRRSLLGLLVGQSVVMAAMAIAVHPLVVVVLLFRSVAMGLIAPIARSVIHPRVGSGQRATYLSLQSLVGRLAFSATLLLAARAVGEVTHLDHAAMRTVLLGYLALAALVGWALTRMHGPDAV